MYAIIENDKIIEVLNIKKKYKARAAFAVFLAFKGKGGNFKLVKIIDEV